MKQSFAQAYVSWKSNNHMRYFLAILKKTLKVMITYKWHYIIALLMNPLILFIFISIFQAIYAYDGNRIILGYTCSQMIWYYAAITFFYHLIWSEPDREISEEIISGQMALRLTQPVSVMKATFANAAASKISNLLSGFLPTFIMYLWFVYPDFLTAAAFIKYLALSVLAFVLFYLFSFLTGTFAFKFHNIAALQSVKVFFVLMTGAYIPFDFFPGVLQAIVKALPFQYVFYIPIQFLLNKPETRDPGYFLMIVLTQIIWIGVFYGLGIVSWRAALKRFYAVGG
ncbi:MAG: ABC-2 family transporter protein [Firmicutes bacterium]|nr:ABC-2 family transporter protein [Bacillota bacterium]